jgi:hypothetical protein
VAAAPQTGSNMVQVNQQSAAFSAAAAAATPILVQTSGTGSSIRHASSAGGGDPSPLGDPGRSAHYMDHTAPVPRR